MPRPPSLLVLVLILASLPLCLAAGETIPQDIARAAAAAGDAIGAARACGTAEEALDPLSTGYVRRIAPHPQAGRLAALFAIAQVSAYERTLLDGGAACAGVAERLEALRRSD